MYGEAGQRPSAACVAGDPFEGDEAARRPVLDEVDDPLRTPERLSWSSTKRGSRGDVCAHAAMVARGALAGLWWRLGPLVSADTLGLPWRFACWDRWSRPPTGGSGASGVADRRP
jgi:hypothetical protein